MLVVADEEIPGLEQNLGEGVQLLKAPAHQLDRSILSNADALLVRSVTRVDRSLLEGTSVSYVGSATSGIDHIDSDYLQQQAIAFNASKGANANAVVEYCFAALAAISIKYQIDLSSKVFGIVGAGQVGGRLLSRLTSLGFECRVCDPLLDKTQLSEMATGNAQLVGMEEILKADIITLHVPLTLSGPHATRHLLGQRELESLKPGAILINTSRGPVVDNSALLSLLQCGSELHCVLDVWEREPELDMKLLQQVEIGTPHLAGYSRDAKLAATRQLIHSLARHFNLNFTGKFQSNYEDVTASNISIPLPTSRCRCLNIVEAAYPVRNLAYEFKTQASNAEAQVGTVFETFRSQHRSRLEFSNCFIARSQLQMDEITVLEILGFKFAQ